MVQEMKYNAKPFLYKVFTTVCNAIPISGSYYMILLRIKCIDHYWGRIDAEAFSFRVVFTVLPKNFFVVPLCRERCTAKKAPRPDLLLKVNWIKQ